jgi:uncharacterized Ntn-hydrolase superfamily protein
MRRYTVGLVAAAILVAPTALATYSVLLSNVETGEIGGAATSCVGDFDLSAIFGYAENEQRAVAFFTQGLYSEFNHDQALTWLNEGREVALVRSQLTEEDFDAYVEERQYHFLPSDGDGTTWTGPQTLPYAGGRIGSFGPWRYSLAGNILTSERVLTMAEESLQTAGGTIEERLIAALEAGARNEEGDSRCTPLPGDSAYIEVRDANGVSRLRRSVVDTQPESPLALLRESALPTSSIDTESDATSSTLDVSPPTVAAPATTSSATTTNSNDNIGSRESPTCTMAPQSNTGGLLVGYLVLLGLCLRRGSQRDSNRDVGRPFAADSPFGRSRVAGTRRK